MSIIQIKELFNTDCLLSGKTNATIANYDYVLRSLEKFLSRESPQVEGVLVKIIIFDIN